MMNEMVAQNDVQKQVFVANKGTVLHEREALGNSMSGQCILHAADVDMGP